MAFISASENARRVWVRTLPSVPRLRPPPSSSRLAALGWHLDPSFGNYVQSFPASLATKAIAQKILQALKEGYDADLVGLEIQTDWIKSTPCPPRNGPTQNLAGMINDHPDMAATAVCGCAYKPPPDREAHVRTKAELIAIYGPRAAGEIQRLRINIERRIFVVLDTGGGYIQCAPQTAPPAIYCEAQSAESWASAGTHSDSRTRRAATRRRICRSRACAELLEDLSNQRIQRRGHRRGIADDPL